MSIDKKIKVRKKDVVNVVTEALGLSAKGEDPEQVDPSSREVEKHPAVVPEPKVEELPVNVTAVADEDPNKPPIQDDVYIPGSIQDLQAATKELVGHVPPLNIKPFWHKLKRLVRQAVELDSTQTPEEEEFENQEEPKIEEPDPEKDRTEEIEKMLQRDDKNEAVRFVIQNLLKEIGEFESDETDEDEEDFEEEPFVPEPEPESYDYPEYEDRGLDLEPLVRDYLPEDGKDPYNLQRTFDLLSNLETDAPGERGVKGYLRDLQRSDPERVKVLSFLLLKAQDYISEIFGVPGPKASELHAVFTELFPDQMGIEPEAEKKPIERNIGVFSQLTPQELADKLGWSVGNVRNASYDFDKAFGIDPKKLGKDKKVMGLPVPDAAKVSAAAVLMDRLYLIFSEAMQVILPSDIFEKYFKSNPDLADFDRNVTGPFKDMFYAFSRMASKQALGERSIRKVMAKYGSDLVTDPNVLNDTVEKIDDWWTDMSDRKKKDFLKGVLDKVKR